MDIKDIRYNIIDIECLYYKKDGVNSGYFSFQYLTDEMKEAKIFECRTDKHFHTLYKSLSKTNRPMYCYSIDYDKLMINCFCKMVEKGITNIAWKLRNISDFYINGDVNLFQLNKEFWVDIYFKNQNSFDGDDLYEWSLDQLKENKSDNEKEFINRYDYLLGKSKLFKQLNILEIPKIMYYYTIRQDNKPRMTISLKKLQLYYENYNIKFDFNKYMNMADIEKDGIYDEFIKYSLNDVNFLKRIWDKKAKDDIVKRIYAVKAVKKLNPDFKISEKAIYSENNTQLINEILKIDNPNKDIKINYLDYVKTPYEKFNNFVSFTTLNQDVEKDSQLKKMYCDTYEKMYVNDDKKKYEDGQIETIVNSIDEVDINGLPVTIGYGGLHSAKENYIQDDLIHLDYRSQYPSIILQYKELFSQIINVNLYEQVYNMRNFEIKPRLGELKQQLKELEQDIKDQMLIVEKGGNDGADIAICEDYYREKEVMTKEIEELTELEQGLKLILNTAYGLINSNFKLPIANKTLGRLICLKGQSMLLNLMYKLGKTEIANVNTDGIIIKNNLNLDIDKIVKEDEDRYFVLGVSKIDKLIQKSVNSYIKISNGYMKTKGEFNVSIKNVINKHDKFIGLPNALRMIEGKCNEKYPIYFNRKYVDVQGYEEDFKDHSYYLTDKDNGTMAIKKTIRPLILGCENEIMYFTPDKEKAKIAEYNKFARLTYNKIMEHRLSDSSKSIKYYKYQLSPDEDEDSIKNKRFIKRKLAQLGRDNILIVGDISIDGSKHKTTMLCKGNNPTKDFNNYTMTDILKSNNVTGFHLAENNSYHMVSTDNLETIELLDNFNTLTVTHKSGRKCYIFADLDKEYVKCFENIRYQKGISIPLVKLDDSYTCDFNKPQCLTSNL